MVDDGNACAPCMLVFRHVRRKAELPSLPADVSVVSAVRQHTLPGQASDNGWNF